MPADSKSSLQGRINNFQGAPATDPSVVLGNATDPEGEAMLADSVGVALLVNFLRPFAICQITVYKDRNTMRLLLVEDEEKLARLVKRALVAERFSVDVARTGRAGMEFANTYDYDLMILDLQLPELSGSEILRRVRRGNPNVPVLILTARDAVADKVAHFEAGADDYLTKPFAMAELIVRAKSLLRRGTGRRENVLRVNDLELDRLTQQVRKGGKYIELTAKEYALLEYLMANSDRVLSRSMILTHVWDEGFQGATNIVDVYVRHLRNKIGDDDQRLIRTLRGVGYAIRGEGPA